LEYVNKDDRIRVLSLQVGAHKGDLIYWYESDSETGYSIDPRDVSTRKYKEILWNKIRNMLAIAGCDVSTIERQLLLAASIRKK